MFKIVSNDNEFVLLYMLKCIVKILKVLIIIKVFMFIEIFFI